MIVADCGSADATLKIADAAGATVIKTGPGLELLAGAQAARKPWLLFLKAGSSMEPGWEDEARAFIAKGGNGAAAFRFRLAGKGLGPRLRETLAASRPRLRASHQLQRAAHLREASRHFRSVRHSAPR